MQLPNQELDRAEDSNRAFVGKCIESSHFHRSPYVRDSKYAELRSILKKASEKTSHSKSASVLVPVQAWPNNIESTAH